MKCYIYLFRHGVTSDNEEGKFSGWRDVSLTKRGFADAKIVALRLKDKRIDVAFRTRLKRSEQTLKEVLKFHPECKKIVKDDRMIERSYGNLTGKSHLEIVQRLGFKNYDLFHRSYDKKAKNGESFKDVEKRVMAFLKDLLVLIKKEKINVAISAHGNSMRPFRRYFEKLSVKEMCSLYNDYESVYEYSIDV
jgi:2,3-bisphosphoglycerate-dependent phosphoglycerate mutase